MKILITGPECTGKSTLAAQLSQALSIPWFPEYARTYLEEHGPSYTQADLLTIAQEQTQLLSAFSTDQALIYDTHLINLKIWSEYKYGTCHPWILKQLTYKANYDYVFLCAPDLPWQQDGLREHPDEAESLFLLFQKELALLRLDYLVIEGEGEARLESALSKIMKRSL